MGKLTDIPFNPNKVFDTPLMELTQSSVGTFQRCVQRYVLRYLMNIVPRKISLSLLTGTAFHAGMAELLRPIRTKLRSAAAINTLRSRNCVAAIDRAFDHARETMDIMLMDKDESIDKAQAQAHACIETWIVNGGLPTGLRVLDVEVIVRSKPSALPNLQGRMAGMVDALVLDSKDEAWVVEHKTRYSLSGLNFVGDLDLDLQALWYIQLATQLLPHYKIRKAARGFYYNVVAKPQHRTGDSWLELKTRMVEAMCADPSKYLACMPVLVTEDQSHRFMTNLTRIVRRMDILTPNAVEMNTGSCGDFKGCPYKSLCSAGADAANPEAVLRMPQMDMFAFSPPHEELNRQGDE